MPSRFEPAAYAAVWSENGTLPRVRRTGGLADTVADSSLDNLADGIASGFVLEDSNAWSLLRAIRRAFGSWARPSLWRYVQRQDDNHGLQPAGCCAPYRELIHA
ncbi:glycogen synthase [Shigella flexneri]